MTDVNYELFNIIVSTAIRFRNCSQCEYNIKDYEKNYEGRFNLYKAIINHSVIEFKYSVDPFNCFVKTINHYEETINQFEEAINRFEEAIIKFEEAIKYNLLQFNTLQGLSKNF